MLTQNIYQGKLDDFIHYLYQHSASEYTCAYLLLQNYNTNSMGLFPIVNKTIDFFFSLEMILMLSRL